LNNRFGTLSQPPRHPQKNKAAFDIGARAHLLTPGNLIKIKRQINCGALPK
jgi:hypothetical protein